MRTASVLKIFSSAMEIIHSRIMQLVDSFLGQQRLFRIVNDIICEDIMVKLIQRWSKLITCFTNY